MSQAKLTNKNMSLNLIHLSGGNMLMDQRPKTFIQFSSVFNFSKLEPQHEYPTVMFETIPTFSKDVFFSNLGIAPNPSIPHEGILDVIHLRSSLPSLFLWACFFLQYELCCVTTSISKHSILYLYVYSIYKMIVIIIIYSMDWKTGKNATCSASRVCFHLRSRPKIKALQRGLLNSLGPSRP